MCVWYIKIFFLIDSAEMFDMNDCDEKMKTPIKTQTVFEAILNRDAGWDGNLLEWYEIQLNVNYVYRVQCTQCINVTEMNFLSYVFHNRPEFFRYGHVIQLAKIKFFNQMWRLRWHDKNEKSISKNEKKYPISKGCINRVLSFDQSICEQ